MNSSIFRVLGNLNQRKDGFIVKIAQGARVYVRPFADEYRIRIKRAYFDKGFSGVPVLKTLAKRKLSFVMPIPVRGKSGGARKLFKASASYKTTYTFNSPKHGMLEVNAVVVKKYSKGRYKRRGSAWFAYAVTGLPTLIEPHQLFEMYRLRFGIESSYRQMNQVRARTTSRNPIIRLLLVGLAFVLFNLYIASRQHLAICTKTASLPFSKLWGPYAVWRVCLLMPLRICTILPMSFCAILILRFRDLLILNDITAEIRRCWVHRGNNESRYRSCFS